MAAWQEEMAELLSDEKIRGVMESLAAGVLVDEGEKATDWKGLHPVMNRLAEDRPALVEFDRDAREWCIDHLPESESRTALQKLIKHRSPSVRIAALDSLWDDPKIPNIIESRPTPSRDSNSAEFMARYQFEVAEMVQYEALTREEAEAEFFWRYAEEQTGVERPENKWVEVCEADQRRLERAKNAAYQRAYRNS